ncbi:MAG TPA: hypothetical protein VJR04_02835 [Terriglobales bacterium]|nr:hypothetical protein [Terriglobales bacterium]
MPDKYTSKTTKPSHTKGTMRGEERVKTGGKEPGREKEVVNSRSSTSINPKSRGPLQKKMPHIPPA